jgi:hypothetical protein
MLVIALAVIIVGAAVTYTLGNQDPAWVRAPRPPTECDRLAG